MLVNITGPENMTIHELNDASSIIYEEAGEDANVILGCVLDKTLSDEIRVTVIATGLNGNTTQEYNSIPKKMSADYVKPARDIIESKDDTRIPAFKEASEEVEKNEVPSGLFEDNNTEQNSSDPVITFGDKLDVPAFIRNRRE